MDPDPDFDLDPAIFVIDLQGANKKIILKQGFPAYYFLTVHLHHFSKIKSPIGRSHNSMNQSFLSIFA
jgi:hypothetical protein